MNSVTLHPAPSGLSAKSIDPVAARKQLDDRAWELVTDFRAAPIVSVRADTQIDRVIELMIAAGVRMCFVTDRAELVLGTVTSYDIQGEKPMRYLQALGPGLRASSRRDVAAKHVMEPLADLRIIDATEAMRATIGEVATALKKVGRRHLVVVEKMNDHPALRGVFSATRIEAALGTVLDITPEPGSFAEIERALEHPD